MFTILLTLLFLPIVFLPLVLTSFSSVELQEMGIYPENMDGICEERSLLAEPILINMAIACGKS